MADAFSPTPEQALAMACRAPYVLVSASAGTGKTRTLVERVLHLLAQGLPLERLLIITFTRKAAGELIERLDAAFERESALRPLRLALPQAYVATIDSFCARWLRENALAAGIDPGFRVMAEEETREAISEALDEIFHHWYLGRPEHQPPTGGWTGVPERQSRLHHEFLRLIELCRLRRGRELLRQELEHLHALARTHPDPERFIAHLESGLSLERPGFMEPLATALLRHWRTSAAAYARLMAVLDDECTPERSRRHRAVAAALCAAPAPWMTPELPDAARRLADDLPGGLQKLRAHLDRAGVHAVAPGLIDWPNLPRGMPPAAKVFNEIAKENLTKGPWSWLPVDPSDCASQYARTAGTIEALLLLLRQLARRYAAYKRERGLLDFADLELETVQLLRRAPAGLLDRFDMVCVDEVQDVNALQAEIIDRLQPAQGRFLVGDVKQCIYQFRLADPSIFRGRSERARVVRAGETAHDAAAQDAHDAAAQDAHAAAQDAHDAGETAGAVGAAGAVVHTGSVRLFLSKNFRSRLPVLEAVNGIFSQLFTPELIGGPYADEALHFHADQHATPHEQSWDGRAPDWSGPAAEEGEPVELHLFEKSAQPASGGITASIEAEGRFLARRISEMLATPLRLRDGRPLRCGDIAILLRSPGPTGPGLARVLRAAGIPIVFGGQDFFDREEVRDFLSLLTVLGNAHDDVALAALLRSPAIGFSDDDLMRLRLAWPHSLSLVAALRAAAGEDPGPWGGDPGAPTDPALAERCRGFLAQLDRWRARAQAADLPGAVATALEASGMLDAVAARPDGVAAVGNLELLLAHVRRYARERDHGLPGLLRHLDLLVRSGARIEALPADEGAADAVQILSLHKAKGLEYPVVCLPLLGRRFNFQDASSRVLTGSEWIGVDIFDPVEFTVTPTLAHRLLAEQRRKAIREEELRVLYVGLTRAKEKLIVSGTLARKELAGPPGGLQDDPLLARHRFDGVRAPLDWILLALGSQGWLEALPAPGSSIAARPGLMLARHDPSVWLAPAAGGRDVEKDATGTADPSAGAGAADASRALDADAVVARVQAALPDLAVRLGRSYAHVPATRWQGKYWVTELKRLIDADRQVEESAAGTDTATAFRVATGPASERPAWDALAEGTWLHALLEALDPTLADPGQLERVAEHLVRRGRIPAAWITPGNLAPIRDFLTSPLGADLARAGLVEREASFSLRLSPRRLAEIWPQAAELDEHEWLLVQGQIDTLWRRPAGDWVLVDFKSDRSSGEADLARRAERYRPQVLLYREAARSLWEADPLEGWLYFLRARRAVRLF